MTPRRLDALRRRFEAGLERLDARAALVACTIANVNQGKNQRPYRIEDFMPGGRRKKTRWQDQLAMARQINMALGGVDGPAV